jgi:hypothetical protein
MFSSNFKLEPFSSHSKSRESPTIAQWKIKFENYPENLRKSRQKKPISNSGFVEIRNNGKIFTQKRQKARKKWVNNFIRIFFFDFKNARYEF